MPLKNVLYNTRYTQFDYKKSPLSRFSVVTGLFYLKECHAMQMPKD